MCGIAGIFDLRSTQESRETALRQMIARQRHRGPDDAGLFSAAAASIGMCRLAIFDPANGRQPMATPDGRFQIVFNGAIYNHAELRTELEGRGHRFRSNCDTEVLLAAFAQWGAACLNRLRGMFAFAVLDARDGSLFIARDPLGIKPLYYAALPGGGFIFASELNALFLSGLLAPEIDPVAVGDYLAWFAVPAPRTIYRFVANLPPGHLITVTAGGRVSHGPWWRMPEPIPQKPAGSYGDFIAQLRGQLEDTIRAHCLADVPVGAFLSGGLDSSAIVGLMAKQAPARLKTFSVVFNEAEYSEREPARLAAKHFGTEHHEIVLTGQQIAADLPRILDAFDQPTGDGINTYYVSQAAKRGGVTVALSGLGGDELFGGYPSFRDMPRFAKYLPLWRSLPDWVRRPVVDGLRHGAARRRKLADILESARDLHGLCSLRRRVLSESLRLELLAPEAARLALRQGPYHPMLDDFVFELAGADPVQVVSAWEMRTYMADVLLRDSDVFSMAHSLELRVPFVDKTLVEWWWNQPRAYRYDPARPKSALSDAVADIVPDAIRTRRKQGFNLPYARWMRAELRPFLQEMFSLGALGRCPWLDAQATRAKWENFDRGHDPQNWPRVWTLAMLIGFANRSPTAVP
jgi:asparagine synthase (glutamine-hydrolysing)